MLIKKHKLRKRENLKGIHEKITDRNRSNKILEGRQSFIWLKMLIVRYGFLAAKFFKYCIKIILIKQTSKVSKLNKQFKEPIDKN